VLKERKAPRLRHGVRLISTKTDPGFESRYPY